MASPDQKEMFDVLEMQRQHQRQVDRVLKIVFPVTGIFIGGDFCANMNIAFDPWHTGHADHCILDGRD